MPAVQSPTQQQQQEREAQLQLLDRCRRCAQQADAALAAVDARLAGGAERVRAVHAAVAGPARYPFDPRLPSSSHFVLNLQFHIKRPPAPGRCVRAADGRVAAAVHAARVPRRPRRRAATGAAQGTRPRPPPPATRRRGPVAVAGAAGARAARQGRAEGGQGADGGQRGQARAAIVFDVCQWNDGRLGALVTGADAGRWERC